MTSMFFDWDLLDPGAEAVVTGARLSSKINLFRNMRTPFTYDDQGEKKNV